MNAIITCNFFMCEPRKMLITFFSHKFVMLKGKYKIYVFNIFKIQINGID